MKYQLSGVAFHNNCRAACVFAVVVLSLVEAGCNREASQDAKQGAEPRTGPLKLYTVNYPLQYFAERIGGADVKAVFPAPADEDPAYWMPSAATVAEYQSADLILLNGAGYAKWLGKVTLPERPQRDTSAAFKDRYIEVADNVTHTHGPGGEHAHQGTAFTTWLDLDLAAAQATAVCEALVAADPQHAEQFETNLAALRTELAALDKQLRDATAEQADMRLLFSHPVYQYLTRRYGLRGESVHWEPDEVPDAKMWAELDELLKRHPAKWMVWEAEPAAETRAKLAERDIECVVFAPCGNRPATGDLLSVMRDNVARLAGVFR